MKGSTTDKGTENKINLNQDSSPKNQTQKLVNLIYKIVDERIEFLLHKLDMDEIEEDSPKPQVYIDEVQVKKKDARPRKIHISLDSKFDSVDAYYDQKARERLETLSANGDSNEANDQLDENRKQLKKLRKAREKEIRRMTKEDMKRLQDE